MMNQTKNTLTVKTPDGKTQVYGITHSDEKLAVREAIQFIATICAEGNNDRVLWKLSFHDEWNLGVKRPRSKFRQHMEYVEEAKAATTNGFKSLKNKIVDFFFDDEVIEIDEHGNERKIK